MGRRNKAYFKDLHQQAYDRLTGMQAFGESKKEAVANGTEKDKIFAFNTYKSYWKHTKYFIKYIKEKHPECTTLKSAKKYANEWLQTRVDQGLSAWTVQLEAKALGKLYGISPDDENYFNPPKRKREEIKRSRGDRVRDKHFSKTNNDELIKFCRGTGLRRKELQELRGKDLVPRAQIEAEISELQKIPAWYVCLLAAMVCGAIWGAVPGIFKAYFNVNEVITSIMFNWIGLYLVNELMYNTIPGMYDQKTTRTYKLSSASPKSLIPDCGMNSIFRTSSTTIAIFIAIAIAVIIYIVLNKTTFGYELKACGFNKDAAKYAGINEKRNVVLSMTIAGALAGIGAGLYFLSGASEWNPQVSTALPAIGFNGIPVALLALSNPIGVIFAALFVAHISVGGAYLPTKYYQPEIADLIVAVIIYLCAFVTLFKGIVANLFKSKKEQKANANADNGKEEKK